MGWFGGGDKHTGWTDAKTGQALTDNEAKAAVAKADRQYGTGKAAKK